LSRSRTASLGRHRRTPLIFKYPIKNPDELVRKHLKADTVGRSAIWSYADFKATVKLSMHSLQRDAEKIRSFFQKDTLKYAA
jgi:hypothetical protein